MDAALIGFLGAGRHVWREEPSATSLAATEEMTRPVSAAEIVHGVGLVLRRSPAFLRARHLIMTGIRR
ncbi:MAG: hypothetical protein JWM12_3533 [Ilumatobacteraceae bacterium]|nr:hypothetical protein [Ilumatobacteraceae bacterium]